VLEGEANDYVGKGICGGTITIRPPPELQNKPGFDPTKQVRG